jgi:lysyl-tRNA synthetase class 2
LGGEFLRVGERFFLKDAHSLVELQLESVSEAFDRMFISGDIVSVEVLEELGDMLRVREPVRLVESKREHSSSLNSPFARPFAEFLQGVRRFFHDRGLLEVTTPYLVTCPGLEPTLKPFRVGDRYLPTSPEISLKKALSHGWTDIFEIKTCFRSEENSPHHLTEFTMLEWYRGFADLDMIRQDLEQLLEYLEAPTVQVMTFAEIFRARFDFLLTPSTSSAEMLELVKRLQLDRHESDIFTDLFHRVMIAEVEPYLKMLGPVIVKDFPPSMAALAKLTVEGWADRFELYWNGLEIANAFNEVNDVDQQRERWQDELSERTRLRTGELPLDEELLAAIEAGMPPSGGIALGLERLFMAMRGIEEIRELKVFK